ncbi:MAG: tetratricopeptide repeat protein [Candidatus Schekmanbacteria bacterium]|nr:tetratricopeptide repeat protein [Candidatus Schekmanbacteria bacterium]
MTWRPRRLAVLLGLILGIALPVAAVADTYTWRDKDGRLRVTTTKPPAGAETLRTTGAPAPAGSAAESDTVAGAPATPRRGASAEAADGLRSALRWGHTPLAVRDLAHQIQTLESGSMLGNRGSGRAGAPAAAPSAGAAATVAGGGAGNELLARADAALAEARYDAAAELYHKVLSATPQDARALAGVARAAWYRGDQPAAAAELLGRALQSLPDDPELASALGKALFRLQRWDDAATNLRAAITRRPDFWTHKFLGLISLYGGELDKADEAFRQALFYYGDDYETVAARAVVKQQRGAAPEALDLWRKAMRVRPRDATAFEAITASLLGGRLGATPEEALDHCRERLELLDYSPLPTSSELAPGSPPFACQLAAALGDIVREDKVQRKFATLDRGYFEISFDGDSSDAVAAAASRILGEARRDIGQGLGGVFPDQPVPVVLYTRNQFEYVSGATEYVGALWDGRAIRIPAGGLTGETPELRATLYHEYTHALIQHLVGNTAVPRWVNEGLAQWFEGERIADVPGSKRAQLWRYGLDDPILGNGHLAWNDPIVFASVYFQALAAAEYLHDRYRPADIQQLLLLMKEGRSIDYACEKAFAKSPERLGESVREWCCKEQ